jgi:hypothetical protein
MVIDKTPSGSLVHPGIYLAIEFSEKEAFEDVEADEEVIDEDDGDDEGAEGSESRDGLERDAAHVRPFWVDYDRSVIGVEGA